MQRLMFPLALHVMLVSNILAQDAAAPVRSARQIEQQAHETQRGALVEQVRADLASDDPERIAWAARIAGERGLHEAAAQLVEALEKIPGRVDELNRKGEEVRASALHDARTAVRESEKYFHPAYLYTSVPSTILDALVLLDAAIDPAVAQRWQRINQRRRGKRFDNVILPLLVLVARHPEANVDLLVGALERWDDHLYLGTVAADWFLRTDPDRLVRIVVPQLAWSVTITIHDEDWGRKESASAGCAFWSWPDEFPPQFLYDVGFVPQPDWVCLVGGAAPLYYLRARSNETSRCYIHNADGSSNHVHAPDWGDCAVANLKQIAKLPAATVIPMTQTLADVIWRDAGSLRAFVAGERGEIESAWRGLLDALVTSGHLTREAAATHPARITVKLRDLRNHPTEPLEADLGEIAR